MSVYICCKGMVERHCAALPYGLSNGPAFQNSFHTGGIGGSFLLREILKSVYSCKLLRQKSCHIFRMYFSSDSCALVFCVFLGFQCLKNTTACIAFVFLIFVMPFHVSLKIRELGEIFFTHVTFVGLNAFADHDMSLKIQFFSHIFTLKGSLSCVNAIVPFEVMRQLESFLTLWTFISLLLRVNPFMLFKVLTHNNFFAYFTFNFGFDFQRKSIPFNFQVLVNV